MDQNTIGRARRQHLLYPIGGLLEKLNDVLSRRVEKWQHFVGQLVLESLTNIRSGSEDMSDAMLLQGLLVIGCTDRALEKTGLPNLIWVDFISKIFRHLNSLLGWLRSDKRSFTFTCIDTPCQDGIRVAIFFA